MTAEVCPKLAVLPCGGMGRPTAQCFGGQQAVTQARYSEKLFGLISHVEQVSKHSNPCASQACWTVCTNCSLEGSQLSWESLGEELTCMRESFFLETQKQM